eukprot:m.390301 g.390301  ORF g.390301 m.390301 type:complete len:61 (-) comp20077_c0_seq2:80-262(-)
MQTKFPTTCLLANKRFEQRVVISPLASEVNTTTVFTLFETTKSSFGFCCSDDTQTSQCAY